MISTEDLTAVQLEQLDALLADTTPGARPYRPPVARDESGLTNLEGLGLVRWTEDCGFEITDAGRAVVIERAHAAADAEAFLFDADDDLLENTIEKLKEAFYTLPAELRPRALVDIEVCQDVLDSRRAAAGDQTAESTGRHRVVPADDRPTETLAAVGTLPGLPVVEPDGIPADPDDDATVRLIAAIKATPSPEELAEMAAFTTAGWDALGADLADQTDGHSWLRRKLRPHRVFILSIVAAVVSTWFVAWLVMA